MNEGPFCGCVRITYDPVDLGDGSMAERWTCAVQGGCGREFVPKARASQAERDLATVTAERDEARALEKRSEQLRALDRAEVVMFRKERDALRSRLAKTEKVVDAARKWSECVERGFAASERPDVARARVLRALRVLDEDSGGSDGIATREDAGTAPSGSERSTPPEPAGIIPYVIGPPLRFDSRGAFDDDDSPVVAGTDSGGSGAATPEGGHAAPTGGPMPPPEPAGSSLEATRDLQAPATRAELDELRWRVERLENLTGSGSGSGSG